MRLTFPFNYYFMYKVMVNSVSDTYLCRSLCSSALPPLSFYTPSSDWHITDNGHCCGKGPILLDTFQVQFVSYEMEPCGGTLNKANKNNFSYKSL